MRPEGCDIHVRHAAVQQRHFIELCPHCRALYILKQLVYLTLDHFPVGIAVQAERAGR